MRRRPPPVSSPELDQLDAAAHETGVGALMAALTAAPALISWWMVRRQRRIVRAHFAAVAPFPDAIDVEARAKVDRQLERAAQLYCDSNHPQTGQRCEREPHDSGWHTFEGDGETLIWLDDGTQRTVQRERD